MANLSDYVLQLITEEPEKTEVAVSQKIDIDVYFSTERAKGTWEQIIRLLEDSSYFGLFNFNIIVIEDGFQNKSKSSLAFIIHMETGRWFHDITEPHFDLIKRTHKKLCLVVLKVLSEKSLRSVLDKEKVDYSFQLTITKTENWDVDRSEENIKRISTIKKAFSDVYGDPPKE